MKPESKVMIAMLITGKELIYRVPSVDKSSDRIETMDAAFIAGVEEDRDESGNLVQRTYIFDLVNNHNLDARHLEIKSDLAILFTYPAEESLAKLFNDYCESFQMKRPVKIEKNSSIVLPNKSLVNSLGKKIN